MANTRKYRPSFFSALVFLDGVHTSVTALSVQNEIAKIAVQSKKDHSYHDDCGNYAYGVDS